MEIRIFCMTLVVFYICPCFSLSGEDAIKAEQNIWDKLTPDLCAKNSEEAKKACENAFQSFKDLQPLQRRLRCYGANSPSCIKSECSVLVPKQSCWRIYSQKVPLRKCASDILNRQQNVLRKKEREEKRNARRVRKKQICPCGYHQGQHVEVPPTAAQSAANGNAPEGKNGKKAEKKKPENGKKTEDKKQENGLLKAKPGPIPWCPGCKCKQCYWGKRQAFPDAGPLTSRWVELADGRKAFVEV